MDDTRFQMRGNPDDGSASASCRARSAAVHDVAYLGQFIDARRCTLWPHIEGLADFIRCDAVVSTSFDVGENQDAMIWRSPRDVFGSRL